MLLCIKEIFEQALSDTNDTKKLLPAEGYLAEFEDPGSVWSRKRRALVLFLLFGIIFVLVIGALCDAPY